MTWIKSMCKASYEILYEDKNFKKHSCPQNISNSKCTQKHLVQYESLIDLYNKFYENYFYHALNGDINIIVVRFEDLLFHPKFVIKKFVPLL